ncbi:DUF397 domain-containing protein [Actinomadura verrucosospora]|uniref:DUF397 domain-containing protein n=1 Tax=Actinomadura verrucosospora TaxID=46165 RepID=A0A7D3VTY5_ACTVE|nr:DUF397 domain-containing protein [Actinomadura verrucosospora]QKG22980.1 hypothetical protein ACTIVE_4621 [Actinomadura verrucosospora]
MTVHWRKSSYSGGVDDQHCVELGRLTPGVGIGVRDSKDPDGGHLTLTTTQLAGVIAQIKQHAEG